MIARLSFIHHKWPHIVQKQKIITKNILTSFNA